MAGKDDDSKPPREVYAPAAPLLNEQTEEVISKVMSDMEEEYGLLGVPPVPDADGPRTEEIISDVVSDLDEGLQAIREAVVLPAAPRGPPVRLSSPNLDDTDPLEGLLRGGGLHRYLTWLIDSPRFVDEHAIAGFIQSGTPAGFALHHERAEALADAFPDNSALGWLLDLAVEAELDSPSTQLATLVMHYLTRCLDAQPRRGQPPRRWLLHGPIGDPKEDLSWLLNAVPGPPRTLVLLDIQPKARLALEALGGHGHTLHPASHDHTSAETAMLRATSSLEELRWVSISMPIGDQKQKLTLTLRGDLDGSELARLLFERGQAHGLRVFGSLHAGLVVNVLAIYEP